MTHLHLAPLRLKNNRLTMKKLLLILLCLPMIGFGQGWIKGYADAYAYSVDQTNDGGYILAGGIATLSNNSDVWLLKTDDQGNQQWVNTFGGPETDGCYAVQQTTDGGYILSGFIGETDTSDGEIWISKTDISGAQIWSNTYGSGRAEYSVQQTTDGGYIIPTGDMDILKIDANGNTEWSCNYFPDIRATFSVKQTIDGGYVMTGLVINNNADVCIIKVNSIGGVEWIKTYGNNTFFNESRDIEQTTDGGYIIAGTKGLSDTTCVAWFLKTDNQGDTIWTNTIPDIHLTTAFSVAQTTDGGYIFSGGTGINENYMDIFLVKTDANGDKQWSKIFGDIGTDISFSVEQTIDGGYIVAGYSSSHIYNLIKTDGNGNITSTFNIPTPNANRKLQNVVDILGRDIKPQTNTPLFYIYDDGTVEKRIVIE